MGKLLFYLAVLGWGTALLVHGLALAGMDVISFAPYVWLLHGGIFVVWIPALMRTQRLRAQQPEVGAAEARTRSGSVFQLAPRGLRVVAAAGMAYTFLNFILFSTTAQSTGGANGHYYTHIHGHDYHPITAQVYHRLQANDLRGFSGNWIGFYGTAMAMLYPFKKPEEPEEPDAQGGSAIG